MSASLITKKEVLTWKNSRIAVVKSELLFCFQTASFAFLAYASCSMPKATITRHARNRMIVV